MLITSGSKDEWVHDKKDTGVNLKGSHRPKMITIWALKKNDHNELTHKLKSAYTECIHYYIFNNIVNISKTLKSMKITVLKKLGVCENNSISPKLVNKGGNSTFTLSSLYSLCLRVTK